MIKKLIANILMCLVLPLTLTSNNLKIIKETTNNSNNELESLTRSESVKLAEALDLTKKNTSIDMGNGYKIFDVNNESFSNLFLTSAYTIPASSDSVIGRSSSEIAQNYNSRFGINLNLGAGYNFGDAFGKVEFNVGYNFDESVSQTLTNINDEYYEYWEISKTMKIAQIDWSSINIESVLTEEFKNALSNVNDVASAKALLAKYGTHLFDNYYFGGTLSLSRYICSSTNISESISESSLSYNLKADILNAINSYNESGGGSFTKNEKNDDNTKTCTKLLARGGNNLNGITPSELFTFKQEYASQYESGFVYSAWLNSIGKCESLRIVNVDKPVAIWDILSKTSLCNDIKLNFFKKAFDILSLENYSENCINLGIAPGYIDSLSYSSKNFNVDFDLNSNEIKLPEDSNATLKYGDLITDNYNSNEIVIDIKSGNNYCNLNNNNLYIKPNTNGKKIKLSLKVLNFEVFELTIEIGKGAFERGYGTKDQPYLINDISEWKQFINNASYFGKTHFELLNDIDLNSEYYFVGGASKGVSFCGTLNGNNHIIKNGTIIAKSDWNNMGLFGINRGTIKNLYLENIILLNSGINTAEQEGNINAGILVGQNRGTISNVSINKCSIRVSGNLDDNSSLNVGILSGYNCYGKISLSSVKNGNIYGLSYDSLGNVNVGGFVGKNLQSTIDNCYVTNCNINVTNYYNKSIGNNGDWYIDTKTNELYQKEDGIWYKKGTSGNDFPKNKNNGEYFYYISERKIYKNENGNWKKQDISNDKILSGNKQPNNDVSQTANYYLGGLIGKVEKESMIDFIALYENSFNNNVGNFGYVAGDSEKTCAFQNVYYEGTSTKAIKSNAYDGCNVMRNLTLASIGNAEWNQKWTSNDKGKPILEWEGK